MQIPRRPDAQRGEADLAEPSAGPPDGESGAVRRRDRTRPAVVAPSVRQHADPAVGGVAFIAFGLGLAVGLLVG